MDTRQSKGKDKVPDPVPKEMPSKNIESQFEGQSSGERTIKEVLLAQLSQLQLTVSKLVDAQRIGVELDFQKKVVAEQKRGMAILQKQVLDGEAKCEKLEADLTTMDKTWRMERLQLKVAENLTRKQRDDLRKELDKVLKKKEFQETEAQKLVRGLEDQLL